LRIVELNFERLGSDKTFYSTHSIPTALHHSQPPHQHFNQPINMSKAPNRPYNPYFINLGFIFEELNGTQHPSCVICKQRLSKHSMTIKKLQAHFKVRCDKDSRLMRKKPEYFKIL